MRRHPTFARRAGAVFLLASIVGAFTPAGAGQNAEGAVAWRMNHERYVRKIHTMNVWPNLSDTARRHACQMAQTQTLYHTSDAGEGPSGWTYRGENVGYDSDTYSLHLNWMASQEHRDNILDWHYDEMGVGVCQDVFGTYWVAVVFYG